jgi:hypothetical protein
MAATKVVSDRKVIWLGVIRLFARGISNTAARGRATKRFHRMSLGFFVLR